MRAGQEFGSVLLTIILAQAGPTCQETVIEVLIVDGDCLHQGRAHPPTVCNRTGVIFNIVGRTGQKLHKSLLQVDQQSHICN